MTSEQMKVLAQRFYHAISEGDFNAIEGMLSPGYIDHDDPLPGSPPGREGVLQMFRMAHHAFPDLTVQVEDMLAEGDKLSARLIFTGTHQGEFLGVPATGKHVIFEAMDLFRIVDNRIVEHWGMADRAGLLAQLGVLQRTGD